MSLCENSLKVGLLASLCPIEMQRNISFPVWHVSFCHWSSIDLVGLGEALFGNQESVGPRAGTGEWSARRRQCIAGRGSRWCLEEPPHPGMDPPPGRGTAGASGAQRSSWDRWETETQGAVSHGYRAPVSHPSPCCLQIHPNTCCLPWLGRRCKLHFPDPLARWLPFRFCQKEAIERN